MKSTLESYHLIIYKFHQQSYIYKRIIKILASLEMDFDIFLPLLPLVTPLKLK